MGGQVLDHRSGVLSRELETSPRNAVEEIVRALRKRHSTREASEAATQRGRGRKGVVIQAVDHRGEVNHRNTVEETVPVLRKRHSMRVANEVATQRVLVHIEVVIQAADHHDGVLSEKVEVDHRNEAPETAPVSSKKLSTMKAHFQRTVAAEAVGRGVHVRKEVGVVGRRAGVLLNQEADRRNEGDEIMMIGVLRVSWVIQAQFWRTTTTMTPAPFQMQV